MKGKQLPTPDALPELDAINGRVASAVRSHQRKIRTLSVLAFILGFVAVAASILIVTAYFIIYRPKEKEVLRQVSLAAERAKTPASATGDSTAPAPRLPFDFPSVQATMTFFHSLVIMFLAGAVGLLALGTLVLLAVVILSRRATLNQINISLAQISNQLRELQNSQSAP